ncbi:MAG: TIGR04013 family B12-binding domain/radical SAM domain-containing protein [Promethearchaeota archaeon]
MKKLAFVAYYHKDNFYSLNAIIGALETDYIFKNLDFFFIRTEVEFAENLEKISENYDKIVIAISFFTTQIFKTCDLVKKLKQRYNNKFIIIAGGSHPTGDPAGTLKLGFDIVVVGEGEETIIQLMRAILNNENLNKVKGIAYLNEDEFFIYTGKRQLIKLDDYPPFPVKNTRFGAIEITRGCPYLCYFCQTPQILGTKPRHRSVESICRYVRVLYNYYGDLTDIRFITPNAFSYGSLDGKNLNLKKLEKLLVNIRQIIGKNGRIFIGTFPSEVRPEHVNEETLDLVLKYANNDNITIGAQSGSQKILDICHREHSIANIYEAVELSLAKGLKVNVDFIFGLPGEEDEDINLSIQMMKNLTKKGARIHTHSFIPLPHTPFAKKEVKEVKEIYKKEIKKLISLGSAFGDWKKQERFAFKFQRFMKKINED